jgi:hypothetical protein
MMVNERHPDAAPESGDTDRANHLAPDFLASELQ